MTIENYLLGEGQNDIFIIVTVSTPGIARTTVELTFESGNIIEKTHSNDGTGLIARTKIGTANELKGSLVEISTDILLNKIPKSDWQNCYDNLVIKYYLEGGLPDQNLPFTCKDDDKFKSTSGKTIGAEKFVFLTT